MLMRKSILSVIIIAALASCHESIEERASREAREYTERFCPTPVVNYTRTDSVTFDMQSRTYTYYCSVTDVMDNKDIISQNKNNIKNGLLESIIDNTQIKIYKEAKFNFAYILYSAKQPGKVLFSVKYTPEDYNK